MHQIICLVYQIFDSDLRDFVLTENNQKADEDRRQRAHAQLERLTLLD